MSREIYLCKEGGCGWIDTSHIYKDEEIKNHGICCKECKNIKKCPSVCDVIRFKHLRVEECNFRINYKNKLEDILKNKKENLNNTMNEIERLEYEIANLEGKVNILSSLDCKVCGSKNVDYDTTVVLLSCPPKYKGKCECGHLQYINTREYKELIEK